VVLRAFPLRFCACVLLANFSNSEAAKVTTPSLNSSLKPAVNLSISSPNSLSTNYPLKIRFASVFAATSPLNSYKAPCNS
jgi:hypothetical protein